MSWENALPPGCEGKGEGRKEERRGRGGGGGEMTREGRNVHEWRVSPHLPLIAVEEWACP